jgi:hypothetical protein
MQKRNAARYLRKKHWLLAASELGLLTYSNPSNTTGLRNYAALKQLGLITSQEEM